jgi:kinesin family member 22
MTNAGKTHTIQGSRDNPGIFPRLLRSVLTHAHRSGCEVRLSMLEVYQDKVFDLLSFRRENLHIRDNGGSVEVGKLSSHTVATHVSSILILLNF